MTEAGLPPGFKLDAPQAPSQPQQAGGLPPGFTLDAPKPQGAALPEGFVLDQPKKPQTDESFGHVFSSLATDPLADFGKSFKALTKGKEGLSTEKAEPEPEFKQPWSEADIPKDWPSLTRALKKGVYQAGAGWPEMVAAGIGGAAMGNIGVFSGAAVTSAARSLGPYYYAELQAGKTNEEAWTNAIKKAGISGLTSGAGFAAFGLQPFSSTVKNLLFQSLGVQPAIAAVGTAAQGGDAKDIAASAISGAIGTLTAAGAHAGKAGIETLMSPEVREHIRTMGAKNLGETLSREWNSVFAPQNVSAESKKAGELYRTRLGWKYQVEEESERIAHERQPGTVEELIKGERPTLDQLGEKMTPEEALRFTDALEIPGASAPPALQPMAERLRGMLDKMAEEAQADGVLEQAQENYFPHIFKQGAEAASKIAAYGQKLGMPSGWMKERKYKMPLSQVVRDVGLEPVSYNPVRTALARVGHMAEFLTTTRFLKDLEANGLRKFVPSGRGKKAEKFGSTIYKTAKLKEALEANEAAKTLSEASSSAISARAEINKLAQEQFNAGKLIDLGKASALGEPLPKKTLGSVVIPEGWIKGKHGADTKTHWGVAEDGEGGQRPVKIMDGDYYYPPEVANLIERIQSKSAFDKYTPETFAKARALENALNVVQLGLSPFHLWFVTSDAMSSSLGLAIREATQGRWKEAGRHTLEGATPAAGPIAYARGRKLADARERAFKNLAPLGDGYSDLVGPALEASMKGKIPDAYKFWTSENTWKQLAPPEPKTPLGKAAEIAGRPFDLMANVARFISKPLMEYYVPTVKMGAWSEMMQSSLKANPGMAPSERAQLAQHHWDTVEDRMGELNTDLAFLPKTFVNAMWLGLRSFGWKFGDVRVLGGGLKDTYEDIFKGGSRYKQAGQSGISDRAAYLMGMLAVNALGASVMQLAMTGKPPQDMMDLFFPRDGTLDRYGKPNRRTWWGYVKDEVAFIHSPMGEVESSLSPLYQMIKEYLTGLDGAGRAIVNPFDSKGQQAAQWMQWAAGQFLPIGLKQRSRQSGKQEEMDALSLAGIAYAPSWLNESAEDAESRELRAKIPSVRRKFRAGGF